MGKNLTLAHLEIFADAYKMLEVLLEILSWGLQAPGIRLDVDGNICLDWQDDRLIYIDENGDVAWTLEDGSHGADLGEFKRKTEGDGGW